MALFITITTAFINLVLGSISYVKKPTNASHILLTLLTIFISIWAILNYFSLTSGSEDWTLFWIRAVMFITAPLATILYLFLITFPNEKLHLNEKQLNILITITILVGILNILPISFKSVSIENDTITPEIGFGIAPFALLMIWSLISGSTNLVKRIKLYKGLQKAQVKIFLLGSMLTFSLMITTNFIMVILFNESNFVIFGPFFSLILTSFIFYSIIKHKFFGIRFVLAKTLTYVTLTIFVYSAFYVVTLIYEKIWGSVHSPYAYIAGIFVTILFLISYKKINENFQTSKYLSFLNLYNPIQARDDFIKHISSEIRLEKLLIIIISELEKIFKTKNIAIILFDSTNHKVIHELYRGKSWKNSPLSREKRDFINLAQFWREGHSPIIYVEEIEKHIKQNNEKYINILENVHRVMKENEIEILMPLNRRIKQNGFIFLGEKGSGDAFSVEDFQLLESIIGFTSITVQNSITHKALESNLQIIQDFNKTLQEKIKQATKDLEEKIKDLEEARRKEKDMLDIMGHELRTPLSIIKITLGIIKQKAEKQSFSDKDFKYIKQMDEALEREILLLETMISSTKIHANKIELSLTKIPITEIIENSLQTLKNESDKKNLKMIFRRPTEEIIVYSDKVRIGEILNNLVSNSIKYTKQGNVEIKLQKEKRYLRISIKDTGMGIPKKEIKNLGKKFYRINQYINENEGKIVRPGGTGLGLYVAFGLIELMGGTYRVESEIGKGSTFSFTTPLYQQQKATKKECKEKNVFKRLGMQK